MSLQSDFDLLSIDEMNAFITLRRDEDLHLDFKTVKDCALNRDDRKSLAVALSGFANSDGGIIVWGVDARPNTDGVDCATALHPVTNALLLLNRLNTLTGQSVSPLVDGVWHRAIALEDGSGFCVSLIPASDAGPHMAKAGEDRYFKRNGSSFYRLEHFDLEDMFGRRRRPVLNVQMRMTPRKGDDLNEEVHFLLVNSGRASAKHSGFLCTFTSNAAVVSVAGEVKNVSALNHDRQVVSFQQTVGVIHPNGIAESAGHVTILRANIDEPLTFAVSVYCEDMQVRRVQGMLFPGTGVQA